ncbi:MAG: translation initiation factor IF-2 subunit beta [Candidatus Ranarchaeia archaeon]
MTKKRIGTTLEEYKTLLERARKQVPPEVFEHKRFEIERVESFIQGNMTIIPRFRELADLLRRKPQFILKFLTRELATAASIDSGGRAVFQGRHNNTTINQLIERFVNTYVLCHECKKPDTQLVRENRFLFIVCEACGARESVKSI